jgi:predicted ribosomally synthesized peptide with nif11-like leader
VVGAKLEAQTPLRAMSAEQLNAFWEAVEADASLQEKLKGAADLDAAVAVAKEAGFDVSKADLLEYQAQQEEGQLSDEDLGKVAGGFTTNRSGLYLAY